MKKLMAVLYLLGAILWCLLMMPIMVFGTVVKTCVHLPAAVMSGIPSNIAVELCFVLVTGALTYLTFTFGSSLVRSAVLRVKGQHPPSMLDTIRQRRLAKNLQ
ncbi:MAG TPA: hypothetical protein DCS87_17015 [Rheinheimera sp.]|nr:hypothetical protein [Rheinheimera sp.]